MPALKKTTCPISRSEFRKGAKPLCVNIDGRPLVADPKEFSTGSFGYYYGGKITVTIDGQPVTVQVGLNMTVIGSKDAAP